MVDEGTISSDDAASLRRSLEKAAAHDQSAPWYVRLLAASGAWISALLLTLFLFAVDLFKSGGVAVAVGVAMVAAACVARAKVRNDFAVQASLAVAVAGEAAALIGMDDAWHLKDTQMALAALVLNAVVVVAMADPVGRFLAAAFSIACAIFISYDSQVLGVAVGFILLLAAGAAAVWLSPPSWGGARWRAIRPSLGVALVAGFLGSLALNLAERSWWDRSAADVITTAGVTALAAFLVAWILREHRIPLRSEPGAVAIAGTLLLGAVAWRTPGILGAASMLALGYHRREVVLLGLAVASFLGFAGWYYYSLELTLLEKSGVLILSGAIALGAREYLRRRRPASSPPPAQGAAT
jgi:hypothetical protein